MKFQPLFLTTFLVGTTVSLYPPGSNVEHLTPSNFNSKVLNSKYPYFVEFYAPWCGHCKQLTPTYTSLADKLKGMVKVGAIDCDVATNKPLCSQYQVQGFPTIKFFPSNLKLDAKKNEKKGKKKLGKVPIDYQGERSLKEMQSFATKRIPNLVRKVTLENKAGDKIEKNNVVELNEFLNAKNKKNEFVPKLLLVSDKSSTSPLLKGIAINYAAKVKVGIISAKEKSILEKFNLEAKTKQSLIYFEVEDLQKFVVYQGKLKLENIVKFVDDKLKEKLSNSKDEL